MSKVKATLATKSLRNRITAYRTLIVTHRDMNKRLNRIITNRVFSVRMEHIAATSRTLHEAAYILYVEGEHIKFLKNKSGIKLKELLERDSEALEILYKMGARIEVSAKIKEKLQSKLLLIRRDPLWN